jgi:5'-nucleotidase
MRILIANDDGIYSPGIHALARAASKFGSVRIVAPDVEQSSMGHAITHSRPLTYKKTSIEAFEAYRVNGTPADCVALGIYNWDHVDVVLSGINLGPNLGNSMWHSGTLAAAKQAALLGCRGIALSTMIGEDAPDFDNLAPWVESVLEMLLVENEFELLNVNFPLEPTGTAWTKQAVLHYDGAVVPGRDPMGRRHFWITVEPIEKHLDGTDTWAIGEGLISITPLSLDLTAHQELEKRAVPSREGQEI